jgi:hypothetical protein
MMNLGILSAFFRLSVEYAYDVRFLKGYTSGIDTIDPSKIKSVSLAPKSFPAAIPVPVDILRIPTSYQKDKVLLYNFLIFSCLQKLKWCAWR